LPTPPGFETFFIETKAVWKFAPSGTVPKGMLKTWLQLFSPPAGAEKEREGALAIRLWWLGLLAVALLKIWAVAGDEIQTAKSDATSYAWSTHVLVWGNAGDSLPTHPPGMALVAGTIAQLGIPWRLALELLYLAACAGLAAVLAGLLRSRVISFLIFTIMAWHPWTFAGFHDFMADPFVLVVSVALLACMLKALSQPSAQWRWSLFFATGVLLFLWAWSRYEEPLVYGTWALFALLAWALSQKELQPAPLARRLALLISPVLISVLLGAAAQKANTSHFGINAKAQIGMPGLMALMKALYRIQPEREMLYVPITHQALQSACQVSPTLKRFEASLLDTNASTVKSGERVCKVPGEAGSWVNWLITQSFPSDARVANELMLLAAAEVNDALRTGKLPARNAHFPFDPNWRLWSRQLPAALREAWHQGASLKTWTEGPLPSASTWYEVVFDQAALRRTANVATDLIVGNGLISAPVGTFDSVVLTSDEGQFLGVYPLSMGTNSQEFHFRIAPRKKPKSYNVELFRRGERRFKEPFQFDPARPWMAEKTSTTAALAGTDEKITFSFSFQTAGYSPKFARFQNCQDFAAAAAKRIFEITLTLTALVVLFGRPRERVRIRQILACLLLVAGWLFARIGLYGLIKAMEGWDAERYMRCVSPLFILLLVLAIALIAAIVRRQFGNVETMPPVMENQAKP
jgi:hypothetical protein